MSGTRKKTTGLVYSTDRGRLCPGCGEPLAGCRCRREAAGPAGNGKVRLHRESKGRGGRVVTVVRGLPLADAELKALARTLKQKCGVGGAVKDGCIEIQGEQRELLRRELERRGYQVKLAGA